MKYRKTVEHLRKKAEIFKQSAFSVDGVVSCFEESADTIEQLAEELKQYKDKEEQGLLISLPCKMGDSLYQKRKDGMHEYRVIGLVYDIINKEWLLEVITQVRSEWIKTVCSMDCVGKTSFLTEAEAEEALAKMGGK